MITRFRLVAAVLAICGVACATVGAILFAQHQAKLDTKSIVSNIQQASALNVTFTALRSTMQLNGKSQATVYIVPRASDLEEDAGSALTFDAILTQPGNDVNETYVLLNNRAYWSISYSDGTPSTSGCMEPSQIPPIELLQSSLEGSHAVSVVDEHGAPTTVGCDQGQLLELKFAGETFVVCKSSANRITHVLGDDLTFTVEYIYDPNRVSDIVSDIVAPSTDRQCPFVRAALPKAPPSKVSGRVPRTLSLGRSSCSCNGLRRPCLFVHGLGTSSNGPTVDSLAEYWGSIQDNAPCCSSTNFVQMETVKRGWADEEIQHDFCRLALQYGTNNNRTTVGNLILVTHSMGNLVAGGALATGRCSFSEGVSWISLSAPMQGSKTANLLEQKCSSGGWGDAPIKVILNLVGKCPAERAFLQLKHQSTVDLTLHDQYAAAQKARINHPDKKLLCGVSPVGLITWASGLNFVSSLSKHNTEDDGVVDFWSCGVGVSTSRFGSNTRSANYKAALNHLDTSFRNGDGWWGDDRKPVKWFECAL
ncbi:hypothetical protein H257_04898 [Aphanomyces astaci]|uniref:Uncharacterized protein n=1 Tax=Aphanomyces astaci TaxID=112090 RepID=W4GR67_APHAT|nr:hypothetical protein H257_04898 [Aphanomyces astaci]ETV82187.1 hypothetical protein H257_04898 [Aphanomyces astaci]|eukprot:XP_009827856.1 hypothetical protein H257_04898 [Aphanomyces astaci]